MSQASPSKKNICSFCLRLEKSNQNGIHDKFLTCNDCGSHGHGQCLKYSCTLVDFIRSREVKWQCIECKKCNVCLATCESLLLCDRCDRGYHKECCQPPLSKRPKGTFNCHVCKYQIELENSTTEHKKDLVDKKLEGSERKKKRKLTGAINGNGETIMTKNEPSENDDMNSSQNKKQSK